MVQNTFKAFLLHKCVFSSLWLREYHILLETEMVASISRLTKFRKGWAVSLTMIKPKRKCSLFSQARYARCCDSSSHKPVLSVENK